MRRFPAVAAACVVVGLPASTSELPMRKARRVAVTASTPAIAVITSAGKLAAKHVIHAVGPVYSGGKRCEADLLAGALRRPGDLRSLELVAAVGAQRPLRIGEAIARRTDVVEPGPAVGADQPIGLDPLTADRAERIPLHLCQQRLLRE